MINYEENYMVAVWDHSESGWYFEVKSNRKLESCCKPGEMYNDIELSSDELHEAAIRYSQWCGIDSKSYDFKIIR